MYLRLVVLCVHVPHIGGSVCKCSSGWWYCVYMYLRLVVLCVHVPQVGDFVCTCTSGWWYCVYIYLRSFFFLFFPVPHSGLCMELCIRVICIE